jgi:23S rRNA pseudouridine1911/1915/1917 synthase
VYGGRLRIASGTTPELQEALRSFRRQALHAARLELQHPGSGELMAWEAPLPADMQQMLKHLQQDAAFS